MHRFYIQPSDINDKEINIGPDEARHAYTVLRIRKGTKVAAFDGQGKEYFGILRSLSSNCGLMQIQESNLAIKDKVEITLAAAIPKLSKFDDIVDKATQLGVNKIIPILSSRSIVKLDKNKSKGKRLRWAKIAVKAAKQCGCSYVPNVEQVTNFSDLIGKISHYNLALIPSLHKTTMSLKKVVRSLKPKSVIVFIGPEGDFSQEEVLKAVAQGAKGVTLGENVLRCETAVTMVLSILNYEWKI